MHVSLTKTFDYRHVVHKGSVDLPPKQEEAGPPFVSMPGKPHRFTAKEVIYHETEQADCVFRIRKGLVKLLSYLPNGRARIIRLHAAGQWLGIEGMMTPQVYEHTAVAVGDVELERYLLPRSRRLESNDMRYMLRQWHDDLVQADKWILDFSTGGIRPRVARLLCFLSELEYGLEAEMIELLSVNEMADMLGVTPESVSRTLAEFKRSGILQREEGAMRELYRLDIATLEDEAER